MYFAKIWSTTISVVWLIIALMSFLFHSSVLNCLFFVDFLLYIYLLQIFSRELILMEIMN